MSKRVSKTLYNNIPDRELAEMSMLSARLNEMFLESGITFPALQHHIKGIDMEIRQRVIKFKMEEQKNGKA